MNDKKKIVYSIYHIPIYNWKHYPNYGLGKIGCTNKEPKKRVEEQGYSSFEILETHDCIETASEREYELQKEYGYPIDRISYKESYKRFGSYASNKRSNSVKQKNINQCHSICKKEKKGSYYGFYQGKPSKPIIQYDLNNNIVNEWESGRAARRKYPTLAIGACLSGKIKTSGGFVWKYKV